MTKKCPKQAEAKSDGVINPSNYNFNQFLTRKMLMLFKRYESTEIDADRGNKCPRGLTGPPAVTLTEELKLK